MKTKILYILLVLTMLLTSCSRMLRGTVVDKKIIQGDKIAFNLIIVDKLGNRYPSEVDSITYYSTKIGQSVDYDSKDLSVSNPSANDTSAGAMTFILYALVGLLTWGMVMSSEFFWPYDYDNLMEVICGILWPITIIVMLVYGIYCIIKVIVNKCRERYNDYKREKERRLRMDHGL